MTLCTTVKYILLSISGAILFAITLSVVKLNIIELCVVTLSVIILTVVNAICRYSECRGAHFGARHLEILSQGVFSIQISTFGLLFYKTFYSRNLHSHPNLIKYLL